MSWTCHRCRQPLLLHPSVSADLDLNQSTYDLVQDSFIAPRQASSSQPPLPSSTTTTKPKDAASETDGSSSDANSLSARLAASSALFDLLSHPPTSTPNLSKSGSRKARSSAAPALVVDHPLCKACTDTLLDIMDSQMAQLRTQRDSYLAFENELRRYKVLPNPQSPSDSGATDNREELRSLHQEIEQLLVDESDALAELREAEAARLAIEAELSAIKEEEKALEKEEERFWSQYSSHSLTLAKLEEDKASLAMAVAHDKELLERLKATNVYTDAFCIGHSGGIATINGLRLGRLPGQPTEWNEINAAWGQTALLLDVLARKLGVAFREYRLVPKGSFSVIYRYENAQSQHASSSSVLPSSSPHMQDYEREEESKGEKAVYELYGSSDWQIGRLLQSRRFDHAQTGFLACLKQVVDAAARQDAEFRAPHAINKDKIGEASIRLQFGSDETWTRALRHVLVTCNRLLAWVMEQERKPVSGAGGVRINGREVAT